MNLSSSKHNSESESGWTMYLDHQSSICSSYDHHDDHDQYPSAISNGRWNYENNIEELDLSMVSDASSMPNPYYYNSNNLQEENEDQDCCRFNPSEKSSRNQPKKDIIKRMKMKDKIFYQSLDDTASSHPVSHNLSIYEHEAIYSSNNVSSELYSMESNARKQTFKGKSSVKKSYSRSSVK